MRLRACFALLLFLSSCATSAPSPREPAARDPRLANLQRAATRPWTDGGRCAVREASEPWPVLVERCFHALDHDRIEFHDPTGRCSIASAGAAAMGLGVCVLAAPELVVGAVVVAGVVVVGFAIKKALDAYELRWGDPEKVRPAPETRPVPDVKPVPEAKPAPREPSPEKRPKPEPKGPDFPPLEPPEITERDRPRCEPIPEPHAGKDDAHNKCADQFPPNRYPGMDVLVGGVSFDALQVGVRVPWEIKTHQFDTYPDFIQEREIAKEMKQLRKQRDAARDCGYGFVVGVSTEEHKEALEFQAPELKIVATGCKR
ncbi:hypothetical protein JRI60_04590 [Archangium violaceum]|uniref:DUF6310 domain-containing protein n=1 Tax=Archangium violaceum TaxID=83451 RepID=UPI001950D758|nr:DUF6310 domain-containing protein [Archangium violaceum]QRN98346.1 hypothetical protein JRI60_04590 [Archangium violaceum]